MDVSVLRQIYDQMIALESAEKNKRMWGKSLVSRH